MVEGLREEMPDFIDVGLIVPGFVGTEMHAKPVASLGMSADQFAEVVMPQIKKGALSRSPMRLISSTSPTL